MRDDFDLSELDDFAKSLLDLAERKMPVETKKFLRIEGSKLRKKTVAKAKQLVNRKSGSYITGIKRGKVYIYQGDTHSVRVFGSSAHSHLIEQGHRQVTKEGKEVGFVRGKHVFEKTRKEFESTFATDCEDFVDELLDKGLK